MKQFSEATRVQMPAMVHLTRIGYTYFGKLSEDKNGTVYDSDTNILLQVFERQFKNLNPGHEGEFLQVLKDIRKELNDDDLGRGFYNRLKAVSPVKLIDFDNIGNNTFHFTAEFTCKNGQDEFRPDITLFVNGLPLCFVEVKKPNNHGGMLAESARMNKERFPNKKFRRFINITQLMIFSNNMEYDALGGIVPIQGAFYCTGARSSAPFNCFREENLSGQKIVTMERCYFLTDTAELTVDGTPVKLTPLEFKILALLMKNPGRVFSAEEIYERVWNERAVSTDTIMVHIRNIREKIEYNPREPKYLKVVWGIGYKIEK